MTINQNETTTTNVAWNCILDWLYKHYELHGMTEWMIGVISVGPAHGSLYLIREVRTGANEWVLFGGKQQQHEKYFDLANSQGAC